jgi:mono/diheme cytochrome c family protein
MIDRAARRAPAAAALILALVCACGSGEAPEAPEPAPAPDPPTAEPAPEPVAQGAPDPVRGELLYQTYCASCHGPRGAGDGPAAVALDPKPARHDDGASMNARSNEYLFRMISEGGAAVGRSPLMAPWGGSLDDEQIWHVIAFVRTLADPPYPGEVP